MEEAQGFRYRPKPSPLWALVTIIAGVAGAAGAIAVGAHGTYDIPPFRAELRARPAVSGKTEIAIRVPVVKAHAEATTHDAPIAFRVTIVGLSSKASASDLQALRDPHSLVMLIGQKDKEAVRAFAIKVGLLALGGGLAGGLVVFLGHWKRIVGGALVGLLVIGIVGAVVEATYDTGRFSGTRFVLDHGSLDVLPSVLPTL